MSDNKKTKNVEKDNDETKKEPTNYVSKKSDNTKNKQYSNVNRQTDNRQTDNRQADNRQADNRQYDNRQYDNRPRQYNNSNNNNEGNRRFNNDNRQYNNDGNGGNRRFNNDSNPRQYNNDGGNGGNRRFNNDNRQYKNDANGGNGGNRRFNNDNRQYNNNNNDGDNGNNRRFNNDSQYENKQNKQEQLSDNDNDDEVKTTKPISSSSEPVPLTAEQILKREECIIPFETFDDLSKYIDLKIIRGVMAYGFDTPSPIQQKAIKPFLSKFDLIAQAQSGTGKTATFCIGTLGNIDFTKNETQAIVLAHTMELAQQIEHVFSNIGKYIEVRLALAVKSIPVRDNINMILGKNTDGLLPHVVIGTPGRLLDMVTKKIINIDTVRVLVLDEADELLSEGFISQIKQIISCIGTETQIGLFSATMDTNFFKMTEKFLRNPINILINKENLTLDGIKQYNIECEKNEWKFDTLCDLYSLFSTSQTIIYCNFHQSVELLTKKLQEQNFKVSLIHGSMDIMEREDAMRKFRSLQTRVLISTDLLGRGIDVQQVSIVINYDIPFKNESYIHRIGRSGRHGRTGVAINFVTNNDVRRIEEIAKYYSTTINPLPADLTTVFQNVN
jgi:translation initiation factor 4A